MNAKDILLYGNKEVVKRIGSPDEKLWNTPGACGDWSIKDILSHLTSFEIVLIDILSPFVDKAAATPHLDAMNNEKGYNAEEVKRRRGKSVQEIIDEYAAAYAKVTELAGKIPAEMFAKTGTIPWYGANYSLDDLIVYMYYGHKREHCAQIDAFVAGSTI